MHEKKVEIYSELSAQGTFSKPNPLVKTSLELITSQSQFGLNNEIKLIDLGCGKLRHLDICTRYSRKIVLVDTARQIEKVQKYGDKTCNMIQYVDELKRRNENCVICIQKFDDFKVQENHADIILSIAVMNSVTNDVRVKNVFAAHKNLGSGRYFVVITPRNDTSILRNCNNENKYQDGYIFRNRGHDHFTFFKNYHNSDSLLKLLTDNGFILIDDLSTFNHICFILRK